MIEPIQRTGGLLALHGAADSVWTESVKRGGGTAPLFDRDQSDSARPADKAVTDGLHSFSLRFSIDPATHDVTVLIVDPSTRRVVRSVPPEVLAKMTEGELVELRI
jgi:hypothetical protein